MLNNRQCFFYRMLELLIVDQIFFAKNLFFVNDYFLPWFLVIAFFDC